MGRITYGQTIDSQFPAVYWNGVSDSHRSVSRGVSLAYTGRNIAQQAATDVLVGNPGQRIWQGLRTQFQGIEWLLKGAEFEQLVNVDIIRHIYGEGDSWTPGKLKNPRTGNKFHAVAMKEESVCGIRVWFHTPAFLGFRFRIERKYEAEAETRQRTAQVVLDYEAELQKIKDTMKLPPLTTAMVQTASALYLGLAKYSLKPFESESDDHDSEFGGED